MIIGFLGKGGSGKSTLSSLYARYLASADCDVLAIDADHNMDFSYNLGLKDEMEQYVGQGLPELLGAINVNGDYRETFFLDQDPRFTFHPNDPFTAQFAIDLEPNLALMVTGPHTAAILFDQSCSHSLITPLKIYLPFLDLGPKQFAIVDEKAGVDGVGTYRAAPSLPLVIPRHVSQKTRCACSGPYDSRPNSILLSKQIR
jgi:CO dehydrogenase maturation factor